LTRFWRYERVVISCLRFVPEVDSYRYLEILKDFDVAGHKKTAKAISLDRQDLFMIDQQIREPALMLIRQQR
jgi:hypothetical protein